MGNEALSKLANNATKQNILRKMIYVLKQNLFSILVNLQILKSFTKTITERHIVP